MPEQLKSNKIVFGLIIALCILGLYFLNDYLENKTETVIELTTSEEGSEGIYVDISGAVENPGLYKLGGGSRIANLINQSGGLSEDASYSYITKQLNLSAKLIDGQKIYVPYEWDEKSSLNTPIFAGTTVTNNDNTTKINVNTVGQKSLETLAGVGEVYAARIIENRPYKNINELIENANLPQTTANKIKTLITF